MRPHRARPGDRILYELVMLKCNKDLMQMRAVTTKPLTFLIGI